jgi:hypothetical protein
MQDGGAFTARPRLISGRRVRFRPRAARKNVTTALTHRVSVFEFRISFSLPLPFVGVPASLGPGLRTVSGTKRSPGAKSLGAVRAMNESTNSQKMLLAIAVAEGKSVIKWASDSGVSERTAFRWYAEPELRAEVESIRRRILDEAIGRLAHNATRSVDGIVRLGDEADSESVQLSAHKTVLSQYIAVSKYAGLETRVAKLEEQSSAGSRNAN